ncbi:unnamed protein product [Darwinula stevensoni]|uniref:Amino acid permease/ SLC12A domain-containing protein n=1 Tax=Darwinula stevensoni TaxID=69355 RepID=A0A7R9ACV5_9CRUS|nr:unnamed protein product [Darwinula stevensoni]CAG0900386.1 unnamed protein product [Darwinula stevensoni]
MPAKNFGSREEIVGKRWNREKETRRDVRSLTAGTRHQRFRSFLSFRFFLAASAGEGLAIISLCNLVTIITGLSMSAVSTNGRIRGGGLYYLISRSLGPEFGGAIGLMFTLALSIATAMHIVGFANGLEDLLREKFQTKIIDGAVNDTRIIGCGSLVVLLVIVLVGMEWVNRAQWFFLIGLLVSQVTFIVGTIMGPKSDDEIAKGFIGYDWEVFKTNWVSKYTKFDGQDQSFFTIYAVFFPAVTGIVAGANMSGDLKDPSHAIPVGTLAAIATTFASYLLYSAMLGAVAVRDASGIISELNSDASNILESKAFQCADRQCSYGLLNSFQVPRSSSSCVTDGIPSDTTLSCRHRLEVEMLRHG